MQIKLPTNADLFATVVAALGRGQLSFASGQLIDPIVPLRYSTKSDAQK